MKKFLFSFLLLCTTLGVFAQSTVQGHPRPELKNSKVQLKSVKADESFTMDDIQYWVGEGSNSAALVIQWNDGKTPDAMVWGYKWDGEAYGVDMVAAIAKADKRFYALFYGGTQYGTAIGGLGFDLDGANTIGLVLSGNTTYPKYPVDGIVNTSNYDFDEWTSTDINDHWQSGWTSKGYWSYYVKDDQNAEFGYSGLGASSRVLVDGSWDAWNFMPDFSMEPLSDNFLAVTPYEDPVIDYTKGIFFVNEDWFGWSNGSVNFLTEDYKMIYRAYSEVNDNEAFGCTTTYGTIYGDNFYFISKQAADGGDKSRKAGGRLVVADAKTLEKKAGFDNIGGGDGRMFIGVNDSTGYIGASNGVYLFDIKNMQVGELINGTSGGSSYSGQIGTMVHAGKYVFAAKQSTGAIVIDPQTNTVVETIPVTAISTLTQSKDGYVWLAESTKLTKVNPYTLETEVVAIPSGGNIGNSWGAWNAGSFCASTNRNVIYWAIGGGFTGGGSKIMKYDIDNNTFDASFFELPQQRDENGTALKYKQMFYGSGFRVDPATDNLVLMASESGFGAHYMNNWIHIVSNEGELLKTIKLDDYYWFPSVPVFPLPENHAEEIAVAEFENLDVKINDAPLVIDLLDKVTDIYSNSTAVTKRVKSVVNLSLLKSGEEILKAEIVDDNLIITPLTEDEVAALVTLEFNSNGTIAERSFTVNLNRNASSLFDENVDNVKVKAFAGTVSISGITENTQVEIYSLKGVRVYSRTVANDVEISLPQGQIYVLKVGSRSFKVSL